MDTLVTKAGGPAKKHILVVDDDDTFRGALSQTLMGAGFQVIQAAHGKLAIDIMAIQDLDAVLSDINMPGISGIELMRTVKINKPKLPFILMTGFAALEETKEASALGAEGFLSKPFKKDDLLSALQECLYPIVQAESENLDLDFAKLSIMDFVSGDKIKFDIYIRLSETKYLKIANQGDNIPIDRISSYKAKKLQYLYMRKDDFKKYIGFNLSLLPLVITKSTISKVKKRYFLKHSSDLIMEDLYLNGVNEEAFDGAKIIVESVASLLTDRDDTLNLLIMLNSHSDHLYSHSLGVSTYSVMIAKELGWTLPANIFKVAMGGLLHDIGKKEIPREILEKKRQDLTAEEVKLYETHPHRGREILAQIRSIPSDVLEIVMQHHENCLGLGYPLRLSRNYIHPMAKVVSVANEFCSLVLKGPATMNLSPSGAIQRMKTIKAEQFDSQSTAALMRIFAGPK